MLFNADLHGRWARERIERQLETAALLRDARQPAPSIRKAVGHRVIRFGIRLAAEPPFESVRSR